MNDMENIFKELLVKAEEGTKCVMVTDLELTHDNQGQITGKNIFSEKDFNNSLIPGDEGIYDMVKTAFETGMPQILKRKDENLVLLEPFIPKPRLYLFGGGHVAKPICEFASRTGFIVTVIDDRPAFANAVRFPDANKVICDSFEKALEKIELKKSDYVVIVTRGHKHDGLVLKEVLKHDLSYTGMIGSKRRVKAMMEELLEEGYPEDKLNSVCSPIGLDIGGITPDEIAISIVGQLILYKNKISNQNQGKKFSFPEFDMEVIEKISESSEIPKALLTILSTKGSVPRKAGAKMAVYYDGRTIGSIGGGCSEAGVITNARRIMLDKGFIIQHVDMTGDVAESEGMVCGGIMDVLIEVI
ncbi:MAG: xanthine dehydrogenase [Eubacteriaceae bacterium]|nr:xanthine dehydrogenase [Eubacteriaceae bacterium]